MGKGEILSLSIIMFGFRFRWRWTYGSGGGGGWLMVIQLRRVRPGACTGQKSHWETEQPWILKVTLYLVYRVVPFKYHWDSEQRWMLLGPMKSDWVHTRYKSDGETQQHWILRLPSHCHKPLFLFHPHKSQVNIGENFPLVTLQFTQMPLIALIEYTSEPWNDQVENVDAENGDFQWECYWIIRLPWGP